MLSQMKLLWAMCLFEAKRFQAYPLELVASIFSRVIEVALYATFWLIISQLSPGSNISSTDIIGYYLIISGIIPFFNLNFGVASIATDHIKSGQLSQTLLRPINPILYPYAVRTGRNMLNYIVGLLQIVVGMIISGGIQAEALPFMVPVVLNTFCINAAINLLLSTMGFYFIEARSFKNVILHIASFARGEKIPLHYMPPGIMQFLLLTPFPASQYHLTILLQGGRVPTWTEVAIGGAWSIVMLCVAVYLWQRGLRRYEAIGI